MANSTMISSDVGAAFDPMHADVYDKRSNPFFGKGMVLNKHTGSRGKGGSNDANAEYIAKLRHVFDENQVAFQLTEMGKIDAGGGGTAAGAGSYLAADCRLLDSFLLCQNADRKSTRLNSSHIQKSRMPSSA